MCWNAQAIYYIDMMSNNDTPNTNHINDGIIMGKMLFFTEIMQVTFTDVTLSAHVNAQEHVVLTVTGSNSNLLQLAFHFSHQLL